MQPCKTTPPAVQWCFPQQWVFSAPMFSLHTVVRYVTSSSSSSAAAAATIAEQQNELVENVAGKFNETGAVESRVEEGGGSLGHSL